MTYLKLIQYFLAQQTFLYTLHIDKEDQYNVSDDHPALFKTLQSDLKTWEKQLINTNWPRVMDYEIHAGEAVYYFPL